MRAVIQRVSDAKVIVDGEITGKNGAGLLILLGVEAEDGEEDVEWLCEKTTKLRIFSDEDGKMNRSVADIDGGVLVVSQFTLHAKYKKGTRPSFIKAAPPEHAERLYKDFCDALTRTLNKPCQSGRFGAHMDVHLINDGPVTIWIDTKNKE